ncbi:MAG TPA: WYL domain-containing protein [Holophagaceae bacterium]|nr:WYL domain-containing protein [Holophagaceae bacterium]
MATKRTPKTAPADEKPKKAVKAKAEAEPVKAPAKKAAAKAPKAEAAAEPAKKAPKKAAPKEPVVEAPAVVEPAVEAKPKAVKAKKAEVVAATGDPLAFPFPALLAAIRENRPVELIFKDQDANAPRTFEPRQLTYDALSQAWYVFGWDRRYNAERHHRLDLFAEVNDVEGVGRAAQGPYAEGTPGNQIGGWLGGEPIAVKALLHKQWVFAVKQAPPAFPGFLMKEQEDGKALVTFTATDLRAIARWAMQFGDGITVQEPQRLVDRLRQVASAWAGKELAKAAPAAPAPRQEARPEREERPRREERSDREERPRREDRPRREEHHEERHRKDESRGSSKVEIRIERL